MFVGKSPRVKCRNVNRARGVHEEELVVRSIDVDAERENMEPLGVWQGQGLGSGCIAPGRDMG